MQKLRNSHDDFASYVGKSGTPKGAWERGSLRVHRRSNRRRSSKSAEGMTERSRWRHDVHDLPDWELVPFKYQIPTGTAAGTPP